MRLPKTYEPTQYETDIYALWEKSGAFTPVRRGNGDNFSVVLPPPNANGDLHVGHSLMFALQDAIVRYQRMRGKAVLWLPGADHAGFETQVVYEKQLAATGKSRFDFTRDELYAQIWDFVAQNRDNYQTQFRRLGASVDWESHVYTLDDKIIKQAYATFKKMWDDKLIYRGERLVNYCTFHGTGFADIEVAYETAKTPLYYLKYGPFTLATTRPETKFGDTAVAVHSDDERYKEWVGKVVTVNGVNGPFDIQVIADEMVDPSFGTGVVKITPAHSFDDWEAAQRHGLPAVRVISHDGTMNERAGRFRGLTVLEARKAVVAALKDMDLLEKVDEDYETRIGKCYKCGTVIEPMLMEQWFIDMKPLAKAAIKALREDKIRFYPDSKKQQLITYLKELKDWNISRQIAWGIPIPAFQNVNDPDEWIYNERVDQEILTVGDKTYHRDPDVFDTWFSSSSWPYATLDYPDGENYKQFYPNSLMETGGEILYPWVSRMIMFGLYVTGEVPFRDVYIHGYVLAEDGAKMSKSLGNVISPMEIVDQYGSDALRLGLMAGRAPAVNRGFNLQKVEDGRNFANKLWNIARFIEDKIGDDFAVHGHPKAETSADAWMLLKLQQSTEVISQFLDEYRFSEAYDAVYHLVWDDLADWYVEASKVRLNTDVLAYTLQTVLQLAHPFAPFVTETIWQTLKREGESLLMTSPWPTPAHTSHDEAETFETVKNIVSEIRFIDGVLHLRSGFNLYHTGDKIITEQAEFIKALAGLASIQEVRDGHGLHLTNTDSRCWLDLDHQSMQTFLNQLKLKRDDQTKLIEQLKARLANKDYLANAPKHIVEETRVQLENAQAQLKKLQEEYSRFSR